MTPPSLAVRLSVVLLFFVAVISSGQPSMAPRRVDDDLSIDSPTSCDIEAVSNAVPEISTAPSAVKTELDELALRYNTSIASWEARADEVRRGILQGAGLDPLPVRQRMDIRSHDRRIKDGYTIENVAIEISPGYYLAGNLYRPLGRTGKVPAIAHPIGHFKQDGWLTRTQPEMQARAGHLAQMGAVVFAYDMVGWGETRQVPHSSKRALALQLWNSIRAIDFLESLPEVDKTRIAMMGASSGGTQTILAAAVDPRQPGHRWAGARGNPPVGGGAAARARCGARRRAHRCGRSRSASAGQRARRTVPGQCRAWRRARIRRPDRRHV